MDKQEKKAKAKAARKEWWEKNKQDVTNLVWYVFGYALGGAVGYFTGKKVTTYQSACANAALREKGIIKYFNPATNTEVDVDEAVNIAREVFKK